MSWLIRTFTSHAGRKFVAAATGLAVVAFLIAHLAGNLQIFSASSLFDDYAHDLHNSPLIVIGDIGLLIVFPLHILAVISLAIENKKARGAHGYKKRGTKQKRPLAQVLASKTTLVGGVVILAFTVIHLLHFRVRHDEITQNEALGGSLRAEVIDTLQQPHWGILYIVGSLMVGWHVFHGFQAAFRSLGFAHHRYTPLIVKAGTGLSVILALGFAAIPAWILFIR